jgi:hypothetical protein
MSISERGTDKLPAICLAASANNLPNIKSSWQILSTVPVSLQEASNINSLISFS